MLIVDSIFLGCIEKSGEKMLLCDVISLYYTVGILFSHFIKDEF